MTRPEEMQVPQNVRTQFDTSEINTNMNVTEESNKESYYADAPYIPAADPRAVNVVKKIAEGVPYFAVNDDPVCSTTASVLMRSMIMEDFGIEPAPMSIEDFKSALATGGYIFLTGDLTVEEQLLVEKDVIIDLNGHKMNLNYSDNYAFVAKGGNLVLGGVGVVTVAGYGFSTSMSTPSSITIDGGTYCAKDCDYLIGCFGGNITINAGVFNGEYCVVNNFAPYYGKEGKVVINGGNFSVSSEDGNIMFCLDKEENVVPEGITVNGGTFSIAPTDFLGANKSIVEDNGLYVVA